MDHYTLGHYEVVYEKGLYGRTGPFGPENSIVGLSNVVGAFQKGQKVVVDDIKFYAIDDRNMMPMGRDKATGQWFALRDVEGNELAKPLRNGPYTHTMPDWNSVKIKNKDGVPYTLTDDDIVSLARVTDLETMHFPRNPAYMTDRTKQTLAELERRGQLHMLQLGTVENILLRYGAGHLDVKSVIEVVQFPILYPNVNHQYSAVNNLAHPNEPFDISTFRNSDGSLQVAYIDRRAPDNMLNMSDEGRVQQLTAIADIATGRVVALGDPRTLYYQNRPRSGSIDFEALGHVLVRDIGMPDLGYSHMFSRRR